MPRLARIAWGHVRLVTGLALAVLAFLLMLPLPAPALPTRAVIAWDIGILAYLASTVWHMAAAPAEHIEADAKRQEEAEWTAFGLTLMGAAMSLIAIVLFSGTTSTHKHTASSLALVVITLALSWLTTHIAFAMRYAHEFYSRTGAAQTVDGGLDFPGGEPPDYLDFFYFSFVVGMTFQVSDVAITGRKLRRLAAFHGLIGFLFNTVILALSVNIAASLL